MKNALNWFEIPVADVDRALSFYGAIYDAEFTPMETMPGDKMAFFPLDEDGGGVGGGLVHGEGYTPSADGSLIYLSGGADLSDVLGRVEGAGGKIVQPKSAIGEHGFVALFMDSEDNKVGLHSPA